MTRSSVRSNLRTVSNDWVVELIGCPTIKWTGGGELGFPHEIAPNENWGLFFCTYLIVIGMKTSEKIFPVILGMSALFVATIAAIFSIFGIGMLFSGAKVSAMLMASALELGKVVSTTFLYRYWKQSSAFLKSYFVAAILILMLITSTGIFGWLSSAYQSSSIQYEITQKQIEILTSRRERLVSDLVVNKKRAESLSIIREEQENRFGEVIKNPVVSRNPTQLRQIQEQNLQLIKDTDISMSDLQRKYDSTSLEISDIDNKINDINLNAVKSKDIITFKFVSDALGLSMTTTVKWFIVVIIIVFDPLAVCLILAYNVAIVNTKADNSTNTKIEKIIPQVLETNKQVEPKFTETIIQLKPENTQPEKKIPTEDVKIISTTPQTRTMHPSEYYNAPRM